MDVFFYSVIIVACVLFIKVLIIISVYMCRARRLRQRQLAERQAAQGANRHDASLYPTNPYNQQSPFVNFEETPQPVITVAPGETPQTLLPEMLPPPYCLAVSSQHKPPAYDDIYKDGLGGEGGSSQALGDIDAGQECTAVVPQSSQPAALSDAPAVAAQTLGEVMVELEDDLGDEDEEDDDVQIEDRGTEEAQVANAETVAASVIQLENRNADGHATVSPGGGIAIV